MKKPALLILLIAFVVILAACQQTTKPAAKTKHGKLTLDQIGEIQPGLGVLMLEIGNRFTVAGFAGKAKAWELAKYEFKEVKEAMEVGMLTRPEHKDALESFLNGSFSRAEKALKDKNVDKFNTAFDSTVKACNGCHVSKDFAYIEYKLPKTKPETPVIKPE